MLDADAASLLALARSKNLPSYDAMPPLAARAFYRSQCLAGQPSAPAVASVLDSTLPGPGGLIPIRCYRPLASNPAQALPALIFFHGGGFTIGDLDTHDTLCRQLCNQAGIAVIAVDYRLGPEHRFPAAHDDACAAVRWLATHARALHIDPKKIAVGGDSAGANLAASTALRLRDAGGPSLAYQLLIYPGTDFRCVSESHRRNGRDYLLTGQLIDYFCACYLNADEERSDWRLSPALAKDFSGLPPALMLTAGYDPLVDEGFEYAENLRRAGVATEYVCFSGQIHGFITMGRMIRQADEAVTLCAEHLRRAIGLPPSPMA